MSEKTEDLIKILANFTNLYKNTGVFEIETFYKRDDESSFFVTLDKPEFDLFACLVNYIRYLEGFGESFVPGIVPVIAFNVVMWGSIDCFG